MQGLQSVGRWGDLYDAGEALVLLPRQWDSELTA